MNPLTDPRRTTFLEHFEGHDRGRVTTWALKVLRDYQLTDPARVLDGLAWYLTQDGRETEYAQFAEGIRETLYHHPEAAWWWARWLIDWEALPDEARKRHQAEHRQQFIPGRA